MPRGPRLHLPIIHPRAPAVAWLALAGCATAGAPGPVVAATATHADEPVVLTFEPSAAAAACTVVQDFDAEVASRGEVHRTHARMQARLSVAGAPSGEVALWLEEVAVHEEVDGRVRTIRVDEVGVREQVGDTLRTALVADDADARRQIELLFGAPHSFVRFDGRLRVVERRAEALPDFDLLRANPPDIAPSWLLAMPVLPGRAAVGDCWRGTRWVQLVEEDARHFGAHEIALQYCLVRAADRVATYAIAGAGRLDEHAASATQGPIRWSLRGEASLLRAGGRLVVGYVEGTMESRTAIARFRVGTICDPPAPDDPAR